MTLEAAMETSNPYGVGLEVLDKVPLETLREKLRDREAKAAEEARRARHGRLAALRSLMLEEPLTLRLLAPEHSRTSCSDDDRANGLGSNEDGLPRCARCALLDIRDRREEILPEDLEITIDVDFRPARRA